MGARGRSFRAVLLRASWSAWWASLVLGLACNSVDEGQIEAKPSGGIGSAAGQGGAGASGVSGAGASGVSGASASGASGGGDAAVPDAAVCRPNTGENRQECPEVCPELCNDEDDDCDERVDEAPASLDCVLFSAISVCGGGQCEVVECEQGFASCDNDDATGCEAELAVDARNCGQCRRNCNTSLANVEATSCADGECAVQACEEGFASCDDDDRNGCETSIFEPSHCGGCDGDEDQQPCTGFANVAATACPDGSCEIDDCEDGFANCDGIVDNGCERDTSERGPCEVRVKEITIDSSFVGETLQDFPVLVRLGDDEDLKLARGDGADIFFTTDQGVAGGPGALAFEIEDFDREAGNLIAWVRVPSVSSSGDTVFYLHCADGIDHSAANTPADTWSGGYASVLHFTGALRDSAAPARTLVDNGSSDESAGHIAAARAFAPEAFIELGTGVLPSAPSYTLSAWVRVPVGGGDNTCRYAMDASATNDPYAGSALGVRRDNGALCAYIDGNWRSSASDRVSDDAWSLIVLRYAIASSGTAESSLNGQAFEALYSGNTQDASNGASSVFRVGGWAGDAYYFEGTLDELRVASTARSEHWMRAEYENQRAGSTFLRFATP